MPASHPSRGDRQGAKERGDAPLLRLSGTARVWILSGVLGALAALVYVGAVRSLPELDAPLRFPWWILAGMFYLAEVYVVHIPVRRDATTFSLSEIPLVVGLFFAHPPDVVLALLVGALVGLAIHQRQSALKVVYNLAHYALEASVAVVVFHTVLGGAQPLGPVGWAATFLATLVTTLIAVSSLFLAISLSEGRPQLHLLPQVAGLGIVVTFLTNTGLALIGVTVLWHEARAAWLLAIPAVTVLIAYRTYAGVRQRHESLEFLYEATRVAHESLDVDDVTLALLRHTREMFLSEIAEIVLFPAAEGEPALRTTLGPGDATEAMVQEELDPKTGVWARVASEGESVLLPRPISNARLATYFDARGIHDAMVAPLRAESGVIGTVLVGNRIGDASTFDAADLKLFETLVNHASVSLQNARLVRRLEESLAQLTHLNQLKDDFVASVSHELRTPLTVIQGFIKTLLVPGVAYTESEQRAFLEAAERHGERLRRLIEQLLVVARLESTRPWIQVSSVSLEAVARQAVEELEPQASGHRFALEFDPDLPPVVTDEDKVHQILTNLVENALKYGPASSTITVSGRPGPTGVVVSVSDEGGGIPAEHQDRIFERFYQVNSGPTRTVGGTGLGLYICRRLAEELGGRIWLERSDESGSVFSLSIPIQPASHPAATAPPAAVDASQLN